MTITITTGTKQLKTFISETSHLTDVYRGIQRNYVWGNKSKEGYNDSLLKGTAVGSFVLADVGTCYERAKMDGNLTDMEFFNDFMEKKFEYISIDGNNRTQFILSEYGKYVRNYRDASVEVRKVLNNEVTINIIKYATKRELHQIAIDINSNTSWNKQETRNAILGPVSDYIRKISEEMEPVSLEIKGLNIKRLSDDEMYATFLYYSQYMNNNITSKNLTTLYENTSELSDLKLFENVLSNWGEVIKIMSSQEVGRIKSVSHNLFYFLWYLRKRHNYKLNSDKIKSFTDKYVEMENQRLRVSLDTNTGINSWYEINRYSVKNIDKKVKTIYNDFMDYVDVYFYKLDPVRNFKVEDKLRKCVETEGVINKLDGTVDVITPLQSMDGDLIEGDHTIPHTKGGVSKLVNLSLLTKTDNRKKGDKVIV